MRSSQCTHLPRCSSICGAKLIPCNQINQIQCTNIFQYSVTEELSLQAGFSQFDSYPRFFNSNPHSRCSKPPFSSPPSSIFTIDLQKKIDQTSGMFSSPSRFFPSFSSTIFCFPHVSHRYPVAPLVPSGTSTSPAWASKTETSGTEITFLVPGEGWVQDWFRKIFSGNIQKSLVFTIGFYYLGLPDVLNPCKPI